MALEGELLHYLQTAAELMTAGKENCLRSAVAGIEGELPESDRHRLVRRTPWDLIRMFDAASLP